MQKSVSSVFYTSEVIIVTADVAREKKPLLLGKSSRKRQFFLGNVLVDSELSPTLSHSHN